MGEERGERGSEDEDGVQVLNCFPRGWLFWDGKNFECILEVRSPREMSGKFPKCHETKFPGLPVF